MRVRPVLDADAFWAEIEFIADPDSLEWGPREIHAIEEFHGVDAR